MISLTLFESTLGYEDEGTINKLSNYCKKIRFGVLNFLKNH